MSAETATGFERLVGPVMRAIALRDSDLLDDHITAYHALHVLLAIGAEHPEYLAALIRTWDTSPPASAYWRDIASQIVRDFPAELLPARDARAGAAG